MKLGDALTPLLFNVASEQFIVRVHANQKRLKFNGTN
jgi:hypothetical protein